MMHARSRFILKSGAILMAVCALLAMAFPAGPAQAASVVGLTSPEDVMAFFDKEIGDQLADRNIPGAAVAVVKGGTVYFTKGYGYASLDPATPVSPGQTLFRIASVTKLFTWTAVMQLVEQGLLDLDADINAYLDFPVPPTYDEPITMRHLMTHTTGFEDLNFETIAADQDRLMPLADWLRTHMPKRVRRPGELSAYSNYASGLAGYIVERVSGMPYDVYVQEKILSPLGMAHTSALQPLPNRLAADLSRGFLRQNGMNRPQAFEFWQSGPAASMSATASDMARFMLAHLQNGQLDGTRIMSAKTAQLMHSQLFTHDERVNGFAYGFMEMSQNGRRVIGHDGSTRCFQSILALLPDEDVGLFVAYNGQSGDLLTDRLLEAFLDRFYPGDETALTVPDTPNHAVKAAGYYRSTRTSLSTIEKVKQLFTPFRVATTADGHLVFATRGKPMEYVEVSPMVYKSVESEEFIVLRADERGQVTHIFQNNTPIRAYERLEWHDNPLLHAILMATCLLILLSSIPIAATRKRPVPQPRMAQLSWRVLVAEAILALVSGPLVAMQLIDIRPFINGDVLFIRLTLLVPFAMILLTAIIVALAVVSWCRKYWSTGLRVYYSAAAVSAVALVGVMNYWNMIGWRF